MVIKGVKIPRVCERKEERAVCECGMVGGRIGNWESGGGVCYSV